MVIKVISLQIQAENSFKLGLGGAGSGRGISPMWVGFHQWTITLSYADAKIDT